jgi:AcrR family transcriptional regulator
MRPIDATKERRILETAAKLFAHRRYHEVRMEDLAAEAGVAKGTLYRYFKDKEDLYLGLILDGMERLFAAVQHSATKAQTPEEGLLLYVRELVKFNERHPFFLELIQRVEVFLPDSGNADLQARRLQFRGFVEDLLRQLDATGRFRVRDVPLARMALVGITREILRTAPRPWPEQLPEWIVQQFLHGIA